MDEELTRIIDLLESINTHLESIDRHLETLNEGTNWLLDTGVGDKLDTIVSKLDDIDNSISNISLG